MNKIQASALNRTAEEAFKTFASCLFKSGTETKVPSLNNSKYLFYKTDLNNTVSNPTVQRWRQRGWLIEAGKDGRRMVLEIPNHIAAQVQKLFAGEPLNLPPITPDIPQ